MRNSNYDDLVQGLEFRDWYFKLGIGIWIRDWNLEIGICECDWWSGSKLVFEIGHRDMEWEWDGD